MKYLLILISFSMFLDSAQSQNYIDMDVSGNLRVVTGYVKHTSSQTGVDARTVLYQNGQEMWASEYSAHGGLWGNKWTDQGAKILLHRDRVIVAVQSTGYELYERSWIELKKIAIIAYDFSSGARIWAHHFDDSPHGCDKFIDMVIHPKTGEVIVTGYSDKQAYFGTDYDLFAFSLDPETGKASWPETFYYRGGPENGFDIPIGIEVGNDGNIIIVAKTGSPWPGGYFLGQSYKTLLIKLSSEGELIWANQFVNLRNQNPKYSEELPIAFTTTNEDIIILAEESDREPIITESGGYFNEQVYPLLITLSASDGSVVSDQKLSSKIASLADFGSDNDGNLYVIGESIKQGSLRSSFVCKLQKNGSSYELSWLESLPLLRTQFFAAPTNGSGVIVNRALTNTGWKLELFKYDSGGGTTLQHRQNGKPFAAKFSSTGSAVVIGINDSDYPFVDLNLLPDYSANPENFTLHQNYPNPFNPTTTIEYGLTQDAQVKLVIYNLLGQKVRVLVDEQKPVGSYSVVWDGTDELGVRIPSGVYIYRLQTEQFVDTKKMTLLK